MDLAHAAGGPEHLRPEAAAVITGILDGLLGEPLPVAVEWEPRIYVLTATGRRDLGAPERIQLGALASNFPLLR
jgi:hypothetical protein